MAWGPQHHGTWFWLVAGALAFGILTGCSSAPEPEITDPLHTASTTSDNRSRSQSDVSSDDPYSEAKPMNRTDGDPGAPLLSRTATDTSTRIAGETLFVSTGKLHLRSSPEASASSLGLYPYSTQVGVVLRADPWVRVVVTKDGRQGWMHANFLTPTRPNTQRTPGLSLQRPSPTLSDAEIKRRLIRQSISRYSGSCPCPYNSDRAGRRCGRRSAHSRPGGRSPLCYSSDVSSQMIANYRKRQ